MTGALWLLYLADVVKSLGICLALLCCVAIGYAAIARIATAIDDKPCPASVKPALIIAAICAGVSCVIPSKTTLYAIAAVNVGDAALHTPTGDKAVRALDAWLDKQIADSGKEKK